LRPADWSDLSEEVLYAVAEELANCYRCVEGLSSVSPVGSIVSRKYMLSAGEWVFADPCQRYVEAWYFVVFVEVPCCEDEVVDTGCKLDGCVDVAVDGYY
jgi:hypothetical protein